MWYFSNNINVYIYICICYIQIHYIHPDTDCHFNGSAYFVCVNDFLLISIVFCQFISAWHSVSEWRSLIWTLFYQMNLRALCREGQQQIFQWQSELLHLTKWVISTAGPNSQPHSLLFTQATLMWPLNPLPPRIRSPKQLHAQTHNNSL